jgi:transcriptional regulator with PAS, ATPase and Fis domain
LFTLPPLRERTEDIVPLARHFMQQRRAGQKPLEIDATVEQCLLRRQYPGNIRELRQLVMRIMDRHVGEGAITAGDFPLLERPMTRRVRTNGATTRSCAPSGSRCHPVSA